MINFGNIFIKIVGFVDRLKNSRVRIRYPRDNNRLFEDAIHNDPYLPVKSVIIIIPWMRRSDFREMIPSGRGRRWWYSDDGTAIMRRYKLASDRSDKITHYNDDGGGDDDDVIIATKAVVPSGGRRRRRLVRII